MMDTPESEIVATVKVWDPLVRIFHWSLLICFFAAYLLSEENQYWHETMGYCVLGLISFRLVWGLIGTRYARFSSFVPTGNQLFAYVKAVLEKREERHLGHNPLGGMMILALLLALATIVTTGWMMTLDQFWGTEWVEEVHEAAAKLTLGLVALHVAGVIFSSLRHKENLVKAMITGRKAK